ncbi:glycosyltransferase family 2 protein [Frigidibacter sp. MR17.14]|uniref:glycosyltransferase family 2 protein n=1 Tax=Frigidibacter sp. MR17.14 TaxID=3126509 RepID=UPI003012FB0A
MRMESLSVAFVLPCLNEARTIEWCVTRAREALAEIRNRYGLSGEVIVADNGSTDGSQALAIRGGARVVSVSERGYGAALIGGFAATKAPYLVMGDSDCSYDFVEALPMIGALIEGADLCMGSRFRGEIKPNAMPWKNRYIGNPALTGLLRMMFRTDITDAHCGIRAISRTAYDRLKLSSTGMEFASEMVLKSALAGLTIAEVPVTLSPDQRGRPPHLNPWRDGLRHLVYMFLLNPVWLFLVPSAALFCLGSLLLAALVLAGDSTLFLPGGLRFGDHWAVAASAALVMSTQTGMIGLFAVVIGARDGLMRPARHLRGLLHRSRLQHWLLAGGGTGLAGLIWIATITLGWIASDYGALNQMRALIAAATMVILGSQIFFSGFLLSILSGHRSRHAGAI